jgi:hypothetical protein
MTAKRSSDAGQTIAVVTLSMVVLLGFMGLGIDLGYMRHLKRQLQMAADAAAIAGASELSYCTATPCSTLTTAAQDAVTENGLSGSSLVTNSGTCVGTSGLTITVNNGPLCLGSKAADPNYQNRAYVEVEVSQVQPLMFAKILGISQATVAARAEASLPGGGTCLWTTTGSGTTGINLVLAISFASGCGWEDDTNFNGALALYDVPYLRYAGSNDCFICIPLGASPTKISTPNPSDPLAYLQPSLDAEAPSPTSCGTSTASPYTGASTVVNINGTNSSAAKPAVFNSGTYCAGINIQPGGYATFNSGIYTLTSSKGAGGLSVDATTTVTGNGVGFYNYGPSGGVNFLFSSATAGGVTLTAPNSSNCGSCGAAWQGILFYQDPGDTATSYVVGSAFWNTKLTGTDYFPNADITYALDATVDYSDVVAKGVTLGVTIDGESVAGNTNTPNYSSLANGNPIKGTGAVLGE